MIKIIMFGVALFTASWYLIHGSGWYHRHLSADARHNLDEQE